MPDAPASRPARVDLLALCAAVERAAQYALPAPWTVGPTPYYDMTAADGTPVRESWYKTDAELIALYRTAAPELARHVRALLAVAEAASFMTDYTDDSALCAVCDYSVDPKADWPCDEECPGWGLRAALRALASSSGPAGGESKGR